MKNLIILLILLISFSANAQLYNKYNKITKFEVIASTISLTSNSEGFMFLGDDSISVYSYDPLMLVMSLHNVKKTELLGRKRYGFIGYSGADPIAIEMWLEDSIMYIFHRNTLIKFTVEKTTREDIRKYNTRNKVVEEANVSILHREFK